MKKKYYILMLFTIIVPTLNFIACTNDDDNNINENDNADLIIGKWELVDLSGVDLEGQTTYLKFIQNGLGYSYAYDESNYDNSNYVENKFSWIINGNMLYLKFEDDFSFTLRILQLNHRKLILKEKVDYGDGELVYTLYKVE